MSKARRMMVSVAIPVFFLLLLPAASAQEGEVLTNEDIVTMVEAGVPAGIVVSKIGTTATDFDLSVAGLVALSKAGVDEAVLAAMTGASSGAGSSVRGGGEPPGSARLARQPGETFRDTLRSGGSGPEMVVVPAGSFRMGCVSGVDCYDDEQPVHQVTIPQSFAVSKYEVTFAQWDACVSSGGCSHRPEDRGWGRGRRPVVHVSWEDAQEYVRWLSSQTGAEYRLLSESEWEYAARAGTSTAYSWGNEIGSGRANCSGCGSQWDDSQTAPVGSFGANGFGVHDMHGNVFEWVEDCWNENYTGAPSNGGAWQGGDCSRRVLRGGSWYYAPRSLRSAIRGRLPTDYRIIYFGFRVARTLTP